MKRILRLLLYVLIIGLLAVPFAVFPPTTSESVTISPVWVVNEAMAEQTPRQYLTGSTAALEIDGDLLFVDERGVTGSRAQSSYHLDYRNDGYFNVSQVHSTLIRFSPDGDVLTIVDSQGFPVVREDLLLIFSADGTGVSVRSLGDPEQSLWSRQWSSLISSYAVWSDEGRSVVAIGLLDGRIFLFGRDGTRLYASQPSVISRYPIVYQLGFTSGSDEDGAPVLYLYALEGYDPLQLQVVSFGMVLDENLIQLQPVAKKTFALDYQIRNAVPMFGEFQGGGLLQLRISREYGYDMYTLDPDLVQSRVERISYGLPLKDLVRTEWGGKSYFYGDGSASRVIVTASNDAPMFDQSFPFAADMELQGSLLFFRGGGTISAYRIQESP